MYVYYVLGENAKKNHSFKIFRKLIPFFQKCYICFIQSQILGIKFHFLHIVAENLKISAGRKCRI